MNVIASQRSLGYANHFKKFGYSPTILTHQWEKSLQEQFCEPNEIIQKTIKEEKENYTVYRMPIGQFKRGKFLKGIEKSFLNKLGILFSWMFGHLDTRRELLNNKLTERHFLKHHLIENQYDVVMGIFSPHYHLSNCAWLYKKHQIPYVLDFRDLWNNRITREDYRPNFNEKIQDLFYTFWWRKWGRKSIFLTIVSKYWAKILENKTQMKSYEITNGFEKTDINVYLEEPNSKVFRIVSTGTIYQNQDLTIILDGLQRFLSSLKDPNTVEIHFVGMIKHNVENKYWQEQIKIKLSHFKYYITPRVTRKESLILQKNASVLIFPTVPNEPGFYSGKIFEYISSGKPILVSPKDKFGVSDLIEFTNTGFTGTNENEITIYLKDKYDLWKKNGNTYSFLDLEKVNFYSRENQTKLLSELITQNLN